MDLSLLGAFVFDFRQGKAFWLGPAGGTIRNGNPKPTGGP